MSYVSLDISGDKVESIDFTHSKFRVCSELGGSCLTAEFSGLALVTRSFGECPFPKEVINLCDSDIWIEGIAVLKISKVSFVGIEVTLMSEETNRFLIDSNGAQVVLRKEWGSNEVTNASEYGLSGLIDWPYGSCDDLRIRASGRAELRFDSDTCRKLPDAISEM